MCSLGQKGLKYFILIPQRKQLPTCLRIWNFKTTSKVKLILPFPKHVLTFLYILLCRIRNVNNQRISEPKLIRRTAPQLPRKRNGLSRMSVSLQLEALKEMLIHEAEKEDRSLYSESHLQRAGRK